MESRVSLPAYNSIMLSDDEMEETSNNGRPKMTKKKLSKTVNRSKPTINSSDEESEDEMLSQTVANGIDSMFPIHNESSYDAADDWNTDDDTELVQKVKATCRAGDKVNYKTRMRYLDWETIAFKKYSGTECEKRFKLHLKNVRRHRILSEIVNDVESNIKKCPIKRPLNAYQIFIQDQLTKQTTQGDFAETMRNLSTRYNQLPVEQRIIYESKAMQLKSEYDELKAAYKSGNFKGVPEKKETPSSSKSKTPFMLYLDDAKLENEDVDTSKLREKYANLSLDEKYKYVVKAISLAPDVNQQTLLNKEEQRIFKGQLKTAPTAYSLFIKETLPKLKEKCDGKNVFTECSKKWKTLSEKQKKIYTEAAKIIKEKTKKEQEAFNERHGVTPIKIKRRMSTFVDQNTETEEAQFISPLLPAKKRKVSVSTQGSESGTEDTKKRTLIKSELIEKKSPTKVIPVKQSPFPMTIIHTPLHSVEQKEQKLNSETSDSNLDQMGSDAIDSTTPSSSKKKLKKEKKNKKEKKLKGIPPPDPESKPPADLFTYFAKNVHTGKPRKAQKAFDKLTKAEKKKINGEYNEKVDKYVTHLKEYLATLPKEEAVDYIKKVKAAEDTAKAAEEKEGMDNSQLGAGTSQEY